MSSADSQDRTRSSRKVLAIGLGVFLLSAGSLTVGVISSRQEGLTHERLKREQSPGASHLIPPAKCRSPDGEMTRLATRVASLLKNGSARVDRPDDREALKLMEQAKPDFQDRSEPWALLAKARLQTKVNDALVSAAIDRAITACPSWAAPHELQGLWLESKGESRRAVEAFRTAWELSPQSTELRQRLAWALVADGRRDDALIHFESTLSAAPNHSDALRGRGLVRLGQKAHAEALADLKRAAEQEPTHATGLFYLGQALFSTGDREAAGAIFCRATELGEARAAVLCRK